MAHKAHHHHDNDHDRIARKAHELWEAAGKPHGRDQAHWDEAREIIAIEDSQRSTLKPRTKGAKEPVEQATEALRNVGEVPGLTDQGENLLTSTDREPPLTATPAGRKGRMPKAEVSTSDQPGMPPKARKAAAKTDKPATKSEKAPSAKPASPKAAAAKSDTASTASTKPDAAPASKATSASKDASAGPAKTSSPTAKRAPTTAKKSVTH